MPAKKRRQINKEMRQLSFEEYTLNNLTLDKYEDETEDKDIIPQGPKTSTEYTTAKEREEGLAKNKIYTVVELTNLIRTAIQDNFPSYVIVKGELSNVSYATSGHLYFTLKDEFAQINCVMWHREVRKLKFKLQDGIAVMVRGNIDIYPQRSQYQLYIDMVIPAGIGALELAFRQLKEKLEKLGLFRIECKKPIPRYPLTIAVITSPTGAAIRDVLRILNTRWPVGRVLIWPVQVQGEEAADEISDAIKELNNASEKLGGIDLIILARGGGSIEDLWAFNEEKLAYAIFKSKLPIITGIGHEIDITIADLVADLRAPTPTAAAQHATPLLDDVKDLLNTLYQKLSYITLNTILYSKRELEYIQNRPLFKQPVNTLMAFSQILDENAGRLRYLAESIVNKKRLILHQKQLLLEQIKPDLVFAKNKEKLRNLEKDLHNTARLWLESYQSKLKYLAKRLENCEYRNVLKRGFAIVEDPKTKHIIKSIDEIKASRRYKTILYNGEFESKVIKSKPYNMAETE